MASPPAFLLVPAITLAVSAAALTIATGQNELVAVRVWGGPTDVAGPSAIRLECVRRASGVEDHVPLDGIGVDVGGRTATAACDQNGAADVTLDAPIGPLAVKVRRQGKVLAEGTANIASRTWLARSRTIPARLEASGSPTIQGFLETGAAPMERWTLMLLTVPESLRVPGALKVTATGADVQPPVLTSRGWKVHVKPTFVTATVSVEGAGGIAWEARLPVQAASFVAEDLTIDGGVLKSTVRSLPPRDLAYVRVEDDRGRVAASSLPMKDDKRGGTFGVLEMPLPSLTGNAFLVLGGDPDTSGSTAAAIPIPRGDLTRDARLVPDVRWLDGLGPMRDHQAARWSERTRAVGGLVAIAALLETLLLADRGRRAGKKLRAHLADFESEPSIRDVEERGGAFSIALAAVTVLFGFAVIGVLLVARLG